MDKQEKIKELKNRLFLIDMADHLTQEDWEHIRRLGEEIKELERKDK